MFIFVIKCQNKPCNNLYFKNRTFNTLKIKHSVKVKLFLYVL